MSRSPTALITAAVIILGLSPLAPAAEQPNSAEAKLREALRNTMLQLRAAETERVTLQSAQAEAEAKNKELSEQVATLTESSIKDKKAAAAAIEDLTAKVEQRDESLAKYEEAIKNWKGKLTEMTRLAEEKESQRAKLQAQGIVLTRIVDDQQAKNRAMFKIGSEVLARYERFGLGDALTAREPFVGVTRVKFQNLIQDYADQLVDARIRDPQERAGSAPEKSATPAVPAPTTVAKLPSRAQKSKR